MQYTANYNLSKPEVTDTVDIVPISGNMDIIDTQMKANATAITGKAPSVFGGSVASGTNLNNLATDFKIYWVNMANVTNAPLSSGYGMLENLPATSEANAVLQRFTRYATGASNGTTYVRFYINSAWTAWVQVGTPVT